MDATAEAISLLNVNVDVCKLITVFALTDEKRQDESCVSRSLSVSVNALFGVVSHVTLNAFAFVQHNALLGLFHTLYRTTFVSMNYHERLRFQNVATTLLLTV